MTLSRKVIKKKLRSTKLGRSRMAELRVVGAQEAMVEALFHAQDRGGLRHIREDREGWSMQAILTGVMFWDETPQGSDYWIEVRNKLNQLPRT